MNMRSILFRDIITKSNQNMYWNPFLGCLWCYSVLFLKNTIDLHHELCLVIVNKFAYSLELLQSCLGLFHFADSCNRAILRICS